MLNKCCLLFLMGLLLSDVLQRAQTCCDSGTFLSLTPSPPPGPGLQGPGSPGSLRLKAGEEGQRWLALEPQPLWSPSIPALGSAGSHSSLSAPVSQTQCLEVQAWPKGSRFQNTPLLAPLSSPHPLVASAPGSLGALLPLACPRQS